MTHNDIPPDLTECRSVGRQSEVEPSGIDWSYWANLATVHYRDACILSLGFDPRSIKGNALPRDLDATIKRRAAIADSNLGHGLPPHCTDADRYYDRHPGTGVRLAEFRAWGEALPAPFTFPGELPKATMLEPLAPASRWPWGDHETDLLQKLASAADRFWKRYDPTDATTAPTNDAVAAWLKEQGVADRNAQVMATILRADNLPTGPRK